MARRAARIAPRIARAHLCAPGGRIPPRRPPTAPGGAAGRTVAGYETAGTNGAELRAQCTATRARAAGGNGSFSGRDAGGCHGAGIRTAGPRERAVVAAW